MDTTIKTPSIDVAKKLKEEVLTQTDVESQVIVHVNCQASWMGEKLRIWNTTYLLCKESGNRSNLIKSYNISIYPEWTELEPYALHEFTLIFQTLPKVCTKFDLIEDIPESGGFLFKDTLRNNSDVYHLTLL